MKTHKFQILFLGLLLTLGLTGAGVAQTQPPPAAAWTKASNGLGLTILNDLAATGQTVYAVGQSSSAVGFAGVYKSANGGNTWTASSSGLPASINIVCAALAIDPVNPQTVYVGGNPDFNGVYKSTNGGSSWAAANAGLPANQWVNDLAIDPKTPQTVYAGTAAGVYKTTNGGTSWAAANTGLPTTANSIEALAIDPSNVQTVYALGTVVYKSTNGGTSWTAASAGIPASASLSDLAIDPAGTVYVGTAADLLTGKGNGVFKTTNGGTSWTAVSLALPASANVNALAIDPSNPQTVYAGTDSGAVMSTNGGTSWTAINAGLPAADPGINALAIGPATLYGGKGANVYTRPLSGSSAQQAPAISLSATALAFDSTAVGSRSQRTFTVSNTGTAALSVGTITSSRPMFTVSPASFTLAAQAGTVTSSQTVTVTFSPTAPGTEAGTLTISHNASGSPSTVALTGVGKAAPVSGTVPDPAKQDETKLGVWLDLNTASGNQMVASGSAGAGTEVTIQVFGRNLTSAISYGVTLAYDPAVLTPVTEKFQIGDYLSGGIPLPAQVSTAGGVTSVTFGAALLGGSPKSGNGFLGTVVFKVSGTFASGHTEIKVSKLALGTGTAAIQTSNAILKSFQNAPPVAKFTIKPDALKAGDTKSLVTLDASGSSDPDGDPITLKWTASAGITFKKSTTDTSKVAQVQVAAETAANVIFTLTVTDKGGLKTTATQTLKVIAPPSPTAAVAVDLDAAADNQNLGLLYGIKAGDPVTLQVFVRDVTGVTGYTVRVNYDSTKIGTPAYANGSLVTGTFIPLTQGGNGFLQGGGSLLGGSPASGSGLLATFTFKGKDGFEGGTTLSVTSVSLRMGSTSKELVTGSLDAQVTAEVPVKAAPAASFDDDGDVDFEDFFAFAGKFNSKKGDPDYDARFDLDGDGEIGFGDFFAFAVMFGLIEE